MKRGELESALSAARQQRKETADETRWQRELTDRYQQTFATAMNVKAALLDVAPRTPMLKESPTPSVVVANRGEDGKFTAQLGIPTDLMDRVFLGTLTVTTMYKPQEGETEAVKHEEVSELRDKKYSNAELAQFKVKLQAVEESIEMIVAAAANPALNPEIAANFAENYAQLSEQPATVA